MLKQSEEFIDLVRSEDWPTAVPDYQICNGADIERIERAEGILDYLSVDISKKKVLDFGCGDGYVAHRAAKLAAISVGYDIIGSWSESNALLTSDYELVLRYAPYDYVVLYDVLDHCADPVAALLQIRAACDHNTTVHVRCHPWTSRHGSHLYKSLNKAWLHVFLTQQELSILGVESDTVQRYLFPLKEQYDWFVKSEFTIKTSSVVRSHVESFFRTSRFIGRLPAEYGDVFPEWQLSQSFNDYVITI